MFRWLREQKELKARISAEAQRLLAEFSSGARLQAVGLVADARARGENAGFEVAVRRQIEDLTGWRRQADTATRMLYDRD